MKDNHINGDEIIVFLEVGLYSKDSIFKCLYWYSNQFITKIQTSEDSRFYCISIKRMNSDDTNLIDVLRKLERDFLDFNLRDIVTKETQNVRDLLIAKAFSHGEFDELPPGEISDPVGFVIN